MSRLLAILLIGALAAGCMPGRIDRVKVVQGYDPFQYRSVPYTKALRADVSGNPFGMEQQAFNDLVSETIQPAGVQPSDASPYRIHLAFNGSTSVDGNSACRASGGGASSGDMTLVAALCSSNNEAMTYLTGSVADITGPDDPRFHQYLRFAVVKLFPAPDNDTRAANENCFLPMC